MIDADDPSATTIGAFFLVGARRGAFGAVARRRHPVMFPHASHY
jgi:hypothetical protein